MSIPNDHHRRRAGCPRHPGLAFLVAGAIATATARAEPPPSCNAGPLFDLMPDSTLAAAYIERPGHALPSKLVEPMLRRVLAGPTAMPKRILDAVARLPGPMLFMQVDDGGPIAGATTVLAAELKQLPGGRPPAEALDELVESSLLPLINDLAVTSSGPGSAGSPAPMRFALEKKGDLRRIVAAGRGGPPLFTYAVRDGRMLGSTSFQIPGEWLRGEFPRRRWATQPGVRDWLAGLLGQPAQVQVLFNPAPLLKRWPAERRNTGEWTLRAILAPEDLRAVGGGLRWDDGGLSLELSFALADDAGGLARVLTLAPTTSRSIGLLPAGCLAVGRIAWPSADRAAQAVYEMLDRVDPDISAEYREELAEFQRETGVRLDVDLLANLTGEVAFGIGLDFSRPVPIDWTFVANLADGPRFAEQWDRLLTHFNVPRTPIDAGGAAAYQSTWGLPFAFAVAGDRFFVAGAVESLGDMAAAMGHAGSSVSSSGSSPSPSSTGDAAAVPRNPALSAALERAGVSNSGCLLVDIGGIGRALGPMTMMLGPARPLVTDGSVAAALRYSDGTARLTIDWRARSGGRSTRPTEATAARAGEPAGAMDLLAVAGEAVAESLVQARKQALRTVGASNMRGIGQAIWVYAGNHQGRFPEDLADLVRANIIPLEQFADPRDARGPKNLADFARDCPYVYRTGLNGNTNSEEIVMAERMIRDGQGANFLFVDGHVEFIAEPQASELLARIQAGEASVRK